MDNQKNILNYNMVEFEFTNTTPDTIAVNLFDTNTGLTTPTSENDNAFPNTLGDKITVGDNYRAIAYDSTRKTIAVADNSGNLKIIDTSTQSTLYTTTITVTPNKLIYISATDKFYAIGNVGAITNIVSVINANNGTENTTITLSAGTYLDVLYCEQENTIYFLDSSATQLIIGVNATTNVQTSSLSIPVGAGILRFTYASINNSIYVFASALTNIYVINCSTNTISTTIGAAEGARIGVYNSNNNQVYYHDSTAGVIKIVDVSTNTISATTIAGFVGKVSSMEYSPDTNHLFIAHWGSSSYKVINATTNTVVTTLALPALWVGKLIYANNINTVYTTSNNPTPLNYVQQIDASANQFYIGGSTNYNAFVKDNLVNPKKLDRITIYGEDISDLSEALIFNYTNATGEDCDHYVIPRNNINVMQKQGQIAQLNINEFILSVNTSINYTIPAFTTIKWIMFYKHYNLSSLFSSKKVKIDKNYDKNYLQKTEIIPDWVNYIETNYALKN